MSTPLPATQDLTVYAGATFTRRLRWTVAGTPVDLSDWTPRIRVAAASGGPALWVWDTDEITLGADGIITVSLADEDTAALPPGEFHFQLDLTDAWGRVVRLVRARITVVAQIQDPS